MNRSSIVDILLVILGIFILLQSLGGLRDPTNLPRLFLSAAFAALGGFLIFVVYDRRRRKNKERIEKFVELNQMAALRTFPVSLEAKKRPKLVTYLGWDAAAAGVCFSAVGFMSFLLAQVVTVASTLGTLEQFREQVFGTGPIAESPELLLLFLSVTGAVFLAMGIALIIGSYGVPTGRKWAWGLMVVLAATAMGLDLIFPFIPLYMESTGSILGRIPLGIIMGAVILYLLFRHEVKEYFGRAVFTHSLRDQF